MKKLFSLLMALMLVFSLLPLAVTASADAPANPAALSQAKGKGDKDKGNNKGDKDKGNNKGDKDKGNKDHKGDKGDKHNKGKHKPAAKVAHNHEYNGYGSNPTYHWLECPCGCRINVEPHVDPLETEDDYCFCGYHFSDNADLVTLWIDGCPPIKGFNKNKTEYKLDAYTYKDVKEIKVSTRTFDSEATVELPEDLTLKEGENKFEIKVIAENQKVTKIYTVIVNKEAKK